MTIIAISDSRTVPVQEDLTTEELKLSVLRGFENAHRVDKRFKDGENFVMGDWAVLNEDGELETPGAGPVPNTYLVFSGNDRFDAKATGQCTIFMASGLIVKSNKFAAGTYLVGTQLTVKGGKLIGVAAANDPCFGQVIEATADWLIYETKAGYLAPAPAGP